MPISSVPAVQSAPSLDRRIPYRTTHFAALSITLAPLLCHLLAVHPGNQLSTEHQLPKVLQRNQKSQFAIFKTSLLPYLLTSHLHQQQTWQGNGRSEAEMFTHAIHLDQEAARSTIPRLHLLLLLLDLRSLAVRLHHLNHTCCRFGHKRRRRK